MKAIFKREFKSYFTTPVGFVIVAAFAFFSAMFFTVIYSVGAPEVESVVSAMSTVAIFATPFITMKLFSDDRRAKTDQALLTAPVSVWGIVFGKFFAALALFALGFSLTLVFQLVVSFYVGVNWLVYLYALLGVLLLGSVMISVGMFISTLTESAIISAALTFVVFLSVMFLGSYASAVSSQALQTIAQAISFIDRFNGFTDGILNLTDIVYMVSVTALFVFLSVRSVEKRRWA
ncbi:MAG: ABC transporter permease [Clostridia bacterium]|nr:ABC transporter permease [Clostridia bacterium]